MNTHENQKITNTKERLSALARAAGSAKAPRWLLKRENITQRQWRARKRADLKKLVAAFGRYRLGCAYCPGKDGEVGRIQDALDALTKSHAAKAWK